MARRRTRGRTLVTIAVLLIVVVVALPLAGRIIEAPWSLGFGGRETLTGAWAGSLHAQQGAEFALYLDLDYREYSASGGRQGSRSDSRGRTNLEGKATICTRSGDRHDYEVSGRANRSGKVEALWLEYGNPSLRGLNLTLSGPWQKPNLVLRAASNPFLPDGSFIVPRSVSSADPDDSFAPAILSRQDRARFEELCTRLKG